MTWRPPVVAVLAAVAITVVGGWWLWTRGNDHPAQLVSATNATPTYRYVIPDGTGARIDDGEPVEILPEALTVRVGEVFQVVNDDQRGHLVGPFYVAAGQTLTQRFEFPGELIGTCSVHTNGEFRLEVLP